MSISVRSFCYWAFTVAVSAYIAAVLLWIAAWFFFEGNHGLRVLFTHNGSRLVWFALPFLIAALIAKQWRILLMLFISVAFFLYLAAPYASPVLGKTDPSADLTVMTFNVLFKNTEFERIESHLTTYQPDLVALQEVNNDLFPYLNEKLGDQYPYSLKSSDPDYSATAIFSRYPVEEFYIVDLGEIRPAVVARLSVEGKRVKFISAHLFFYYGWWKYPAGEMLARITEITELQQEQVRRLLAEIERHEDDIVLLGCDCNAPETSETRVMLERQLTNSAKASGWVLPQPELPSLSPFFAPQRVDYIFHRGSVEPVSVYTIYDNAGSDHPAILGAFRLVE